MTAVAAVAPVVLDASRRLGPEPERLSPAAASVIVAFYALVGCVPLDGLGRELLGNVAAIRSGAVPGRRAPHAR